MVIYFFALCVLLFWGFLIIYSYIASKRKGGELKVDNDRDINPRYFSDVLRDFYRPILGNYSRKNKEGNWYFSKLKMHRDLEEIGLYRGDLLLKGTPRKLAGIVVDGSLTIADNTDVECDIWCLGNVNVGSKCSVRSIAADGYIKIGNDSIIKRWVDSATSIYIESNVRIIAGASALNEILINSFFKGGKMYAPKIKITSHTNFYPELIEEIASTIENNSETEIEKKISYWNEIRNNIIKRRYLIDDSENIQWIKEESINTLGDYYVGSNTVILHDVISKGFIRIRPNCIIVGSIHTDKDLYIGEDSLIIGSIACDNLYIERSVIITSAVHVTGHAVINEEVMIGQTDNVGGLAVIGALQFKGNVSVTHGVYSGEIVYTV